MHGVTQTGSSRADFAGGAHSGAPRRNRAAGPSRSISPIRPSRQPVGPDSTPIGRAEFCKFHRAECDRQHGDRRAVASGPKRNGTSLIAVNNASTPRSRRMTDEQLYRVAEFWTYPNGYGDCEDYALAKRRALIEDGWPPSTLLIAVVRQKNGEGHAVLMVRTDRGDLILDNQDALVRYGPRRPTSTSSASRRPTPAGGSTSSIRRPGSLARS